MGFQKIEGRYHLISDQKKIHKDNTVQKHLGLGAQPYPVGITNFDMNDKQTLASVIFFRILAAIFAAVGLRFVYQKLRGCLSKGQVAEYVPIPSSSSSSSSSSYGTVTNAQQIGISSESLASTTKIRLSSESLDEELSKIEENIEKLAEEFFSQLTDRKSLVQMSLDEAGLMAHFLDRAEGNHYSFEDMNSFIHKLSNAILEDLGPSETGVIKNFEFQQTYLICSNTVGIIDKNFKYNQNVFSSVSIFSDVGTIDFRLRYTDFLKAISTNVLSENVRGLLTTHILLGLYTHSSRKLRLTDVGHQHPDILRKVLSTQISLLAAQHLDGSTAESVKVFYDKELMHIHELFVCKGRFFNTMS